MTTAHSKIVAVLLALSCMAMPVSALAKTSKPTCTVLAKTARGEVSLKEAGEVLVTKGETLTLTWDSKNATKAAGDKRASIALSGTKTVTPTKDTAYAFVFSSGSKKADCSVSVVVANAAIDSKTLSSGSGKPTISGTASGVKTVKVLVEDLTGYRIWASKDVKVKKGKWSVKVSKSLKPDVYRVRVLGDKDAGINELASERLTISEKGATASVKGGSIAVSSIPLLVGGTAKAGTSVPVAYIKVTNTGSSATSISGFTLRQTGLASTDAIIGFSTSDDKGGSRATIGGTEGTKVFKNGVADVPLAATIAPGQFRIFTIKAIVAKSLGSALGKQLMLDVASVDTSASAKGTFPIKGTVWNLSY